MTGLLFTGERGGALRRGNFHRETAWTKTVVTVGLPPGFPLPRPTPHRETALAAMSGASTRELMRWMGHSSMRAAVIYQHASDERDRAIADHMGEHVEGERPGEDQEENEDGDGDAESA